jgi:hypothetical protein
MVGWFSIVVLIVLLQQWVGRPIEILRAADIIMVGPGSLGFQRERRLPVQSILQNGLQALLGKHSSPQRSLAGRFQARFTIGFRQGENT